MVRVVKNGQMVRGATVVTVVNFQYVRIVQKGSQ
jgi:hypothetical protein